MKLFTLVGLLFVLVLSLSVFSTEGQNRKKYCCKKMHKQMTRVPLGPGTGTHNKRVNSPFSPQGSTGSGPRGLPGQVRRHVCKPCNPPKGFFRPPLKVGPLPQN